MLIMIWMMLIMMITISMVVMFMVRRRRMRERMMAWKARMINATGSAGGRGAPYLVLCGQTTAAA